MNEKGEIERREEERTDQKKISEKRERKKINVCYFSLSLLAAVHASINIVSVNSCLGNNMLQ